MSDDEVKKKVLIIEDEDPLRKALRIAMEKEGYDVSVAGDGEEGLEAAKEVAPDLILLDIMMPGIDGNEVLKKLRRRKSTQDTKIIMLTNVSDSERVNRAIVDRADYYLIKSDWSMDELKKKARDILSENKL